MSVRVVVTGGRDFTDERFVMDWLSHIHAMQGGIVRLAHGDYRGVDMFAARWGRETKGCEVVAYPAAWRTHGAAAGPIRNRIMLDTERPDFLIVFPGNKGTRDCAAYAKSLGIKIADLRPVYDPSFTEGVA